MSTLEVRIVGGGDPGPEGRAAITAALERTLGARRGERVAPVSPWALAGRLEASGRPVLRTRSQLPLR